MRLKHMKDLEVFIEEVKKLPESMCMGKKILSIEKGMYRHNKSGQSYEVLGVALQTETDEPLVIYRPLYESEIELFARSYAMFVEDVELDGEMMPRFEKVDG